MLSVVPAAERRGYQYSVKLFLTVGAGSGKCLEIFDTRSGVEQDDCLAFMHQVIGDQFPESRQACRTFRRGEDAGGRSYLGHGGDQFGIVNGDSRTAGRSDSVEDEEIANGFRHTQARSDG